MKEHIYHIITKFHLSGVTDALLYVHIHMYVCTHASLHIPREPRDTEASLKCKGTTIYTIDKEKKQNHLK